MMNNRLIIESGSTSTEWALVSDIPSRFHNEGINPLVHSFEHVRGTLSEGAQRFENVDIVEFYGAGCAGAGRRFVLDILGELFPGAVVSAESDMVAAAKAVLGHRPGVACILGTGSNSCLWDGERIVDNIPPMGFILGDEGGGARLGRRLVNAVFKRRLPEELSKDFLLSHNLDMDSVIRRVYREERANTFLASFCPWLSENIDRGEVRELVRDEFVEFVRYDIKPYGDNLTAGFAGSVAAHFSEVLREVCRMEGIGVCEIVAEPIELLLHR